jgi:hypothetical protein
LADRDGRGTSFYTSDYVSLTTGSTLRMGFVTGSGNTNATIQAYTAGELNTGSLILNSGGGNVGIGTASPTARLHIVGNAIIGYDNANNNNYGVHGDEQLKLTTSTTPAINTGTSISFGGRYATLSTANFTFGAIAGLKENSTNSDANGYLAFYTTNDTAGNVNERMRITSTGIVNINTLSTSNNYKLGVSGSAYITGTNNKGIFVTDNATYTSIVGLNSAISAYNDVELRASGTDYQLYLSTTGAVGVGKTSPQGRLDINGRVYIRAAGSSTDAAITFINQSGGDGTLSITGTSTTMNYYFSTYSVGGAFVINNNGNCAVAGALSKGSGTFRIDHPLESKKDTHQLVHSFVEGPRADLIYRGTTTLVNGTATINIDTSAGMTEGTFIALNRETQFFITNQSGWNNIKGLLQGNILTIEAEDTNSTDTIAWMVVGERQDKHIKDTDWTDSNGKPILEPLKSTE